MQEVRRFKVKNGLKGFIPESINFSELESKVGQGQDIKEPDYDSGDGGDSVFKTEESLDYEKLVLQMLTNLNMTEKIIFLYQILRDMGFQVDHGSFAKTIHIDRMKYIKKLGVIKMKTLFVVKGREMLKDK